VAVFAQLQNNFGGTFRADESNADLNQETMLIEKSESWIRRDQRTVSFAPRAARRPVALRRTPLPLHKPRARHERHLEWPQKRQASVCGSAAALRSGCVSLDTPLRLRSTFPACRPQTEADS
jgi:hypothetical protein